MKQINKKMTKKNNELALGVMIVIETICSSNDCAFQIASTQNGQNLAELLVAQLIKKKKYYFK